MIKYIWNVRRAGTGSICGEIETTDDSLESARDEIRHYYPLAISQNTVYMEMKEQINKEHEIDVTKPLIYTWQGPSLSILDENLNYFNDKDVYFQTLSMTHICDRIILSRIHRYTNFMYLDHANLVDEFIIQAKTRKDLWAFIPSKFKSYLKYIPKTIIERVIIYDDTSDNGIYSVLVPYIALGFKKIFLFGMDGGLVNGKRYYLQDYFRIKNIGVEGFNGNMPDDIRKLPMFFDELKREGLPLDCKIYNVCPTSKVDVFEKITWDQFKEKL